MTETTIKAGDRVKFNPGRATTEVTGTVLKIETSGEGRGRSTWAVVNCDDGRERKARPGSLRAA